MREAEEWWEVGRKEVVGVGREGEEYRSGMWKGVREAEEW